MSRFSLRRYLPCIDIVSRFYVNIFPNAFTRAKQFTTAQQQMAQKPYQRFYHPEPSIQLPDQYQNLLLDERCGRRCSSVRANVTKRIGKTSKSSDSLVMRRNRRSRTVFTNAQVAELEFYFMQCNYVNCERANELAAKLSLDSAPVKFWFKNQRRRVKVKESVNQTTDTLQNVANNVCTIPVAGAQKFVCQGLHIPSLTPPLTPTTTLPDLGTPYSIGPSYYNQVSYGTMQAISHQSLQQVATSTPTHFVQNATPGIRNLATTVTNKNLPLQLNSSHILKGASNHEPAFNFNNIPCTTRMPSPLATDDVHSLTTTSNNSDTSDYFSQMSPNSEIYEPLTPNSAHGEAESVFNDILDSLKTPKTQPTIENIYEKLIRAPEPNFNCAFDTVLEPYNSNQSSTNSTQLTHILELV